MKPRIGVILSGSGVQDGSEIHEAVLALLALDKAGAEAICMAPACEQSEVIDHKTGQSVSEKRNVLTESARIARGNIQDIKEVRLEELDALLLPGGFGAAKNLCSFATQGDQCTVNKDVEQLLRAFQNARKPIAALCIAPAILAALFGREYKPSLTIGTDKGTADALERMGAQHVNAQPTETVVDRENRFVTTPCYMSATRISQIAEATENAVRELLALVAVSKNAGIKG